MANETWPRTSPKTERSRTNNRSKKLYGHRPSLNFEAGDIVSAVVNAFIITTSLTQTRRMSG